MDFEPFSVLLKSLGRFDAAPKTGKANNLSLSLLSQMLQEQW